VVQLYLAKFEKLTPEQRSQIFNQLIKDHRFQAPEIHALRALGTGNAEMDTLRKNYDKYLTTAKGKDPMPFAHWCLDRSIKEMSPRPVHLVLTLPDTDVNSMHQEDLIH
jgi:hypothetical protein